MASAPRPSAPTRARPSISTRLTPRITTCTAKAVTACSASPISTCCRRPDRVILAAPLKIRRGSGSPLRVLALVPRAASRRA